MYVPTNATLIGTMPITAVDLSLHTFLGISWLVLLPYTLFGIVLMAYGQGRLVRGERKLQEQDDDLDALDVISE